MLLVRQVAPPEGALLCAVKLLPDGALRLSCWQLPLDGVTGSRGESPTHRLPRSGNLFRTDLRFASSLPQRFACGHPPIHDGHGRPRSVRKSSRLRWKHHLPSCSCSLARRQPHPAQVRQIASQTGVLPRRMRFVAGRGHCSSKSPRARILVLGTSGAHWPARWPRFELTERVAKSQLSGY